MRQEIRPHGRLAELAARQHGVVSHLQLLELGYSPAAIDRGLRADRLHRIHRGVYAVGHAAISRHGSCLAAVLGCGGGAMLSHWSSAWLWGLLPHFPQIPDVTTPTRGHIKAGVHLHHSTILELADRATVDGIDLTSVSRTLLDLAATPRSRRLRSAVERAERLAVLELNEIDALLARAGRHRGKRELQRALEIYRDPVFSRARSERLFLAMTKRAGLPRPAINVFVAGHEIDAYWEAERFAVEIDGWDAHRTRVAFENDPLRQEELKLAGVDMIRITARRLERKPEQVGIRVGQLLEQRRAERSRGQSTG